MLPVFQNSAVIPVTVINRHHRPFRITKSQATEEKDQGKRKILRQFDPIVVGKKGLSPDTAEFLSVFFQ